jgi:hypothetical protein
MVGVLREATMTQNPKPIQLAVIYVIIAGQSAIAATNLYSADVDTAVLAAFRDSIRIETYQVGSEIASGASTEDLRGAELAPVVSDTLTVTQTEFVKRLLFDKASYENDVPYCIFEASFGLRVISPRRTILVVFGNECSLVKILNSTGQVYHYGNVSPVSSKWLEFWGELFAGSN